MFPFRNSTGTYTLALDEKVKGHRHPDSARELNNQGELYTAMGDYGKARTLFEQALSIYEEIYGPKASAVETVLNKEADRRPPSDPADPNHTFFFSLSDGKTVIDASVRGNAARWINHSCEPNCESEETDDGRVFIEALRDIRGGEELNYDYGLIIDERITPTLKKQHECRCGSKNCRGTMLALRSRKKKES